MPIIPGSLSDLMTWIWVEWVCPSMEIGKVQDPLYCRLWPPAALNSLVIVFCNAGLLGIDL